MAKSKVSIITGKRGKLLLNRGRVKEYMLSFLFLETVMIGMFASIDILLFYIFFEAVLIPMYLIIGIWGGARRIYASFKFFLYTLLDTLRAS